VVGDFFGRVEGAADRARERREQLGADIPRGDRDRYRAACAPEAHLHAGFCSDSTAASTSSNRLNTRWKRLIWNASRTSGVTAATAMPPACVFTCFAATIRARSPTLLM